MHCFRHLQILFVDLSAISTKYDTGAHNTLATIIGRLVLTNSNINFHLADKVDCDGCIRQPNKWIPQIQKI